MTITETGRSKWAVHSDSGNTYEVRFNTHLDENGSMFFDWSCDCPAGRHHRHCKHVTAVEAQTEAADDQAAERVE